MQQNKVAATSCVGGTDMNEPPQSANERYFSFEYALMENELLRKFAHRGDSSAVLSLVQESNCITRYALVIRCRMTTVFKSTYG